MKYVTILILIFIICIAAFIYINNVTAAPAITMGGKIDKNIHVPNYIVSGEHSYVVNKLRLACIHLRILNITEGITETDIVKEDSAIIKNTKIEIGISTSKSSSNCVLPYFNNLTILKKVVSDITIQTKQIYFNNECLFYFIDDKTKVNYVKLPEKMSDIVKAMDNIFINFKNDVESVINKWFDPKNGIIKIVTSQLLVTTINNINDFFAFEERLNCHDDSILSILYNTNLPIKVLYKIILTTFLDSKIQYLFFNKYLKFDNIYGKMIEYLYVVQKLHEIMNKHTTNIDYWFGALCCMSEIFSYNYSLNIQYLGLDNIITKFDNIQNEVQKATQKDKYTALLSYFDDDKINYNELLTFIKTHESCIAKINEAEYKKIMDTNKKNEIIQMAYRMLSDVYCCTINNKIQMYPFYKVPDEYNDLYYLIDYSKDLYDGKDTVEINISNQWLKNIILHDIKDDIVKKINMIKDYLRSVEQQNSTSEIKSKPLRNNIDSIFNFQYITFKLESEGLLSALNN